MNITTNGNSVPIKPFAPGGAPEPDIAKRGLHTNCWNEIIRTGNQNLK